MRKYLIGGVLLIVGICFSISASELNAFGFHNTFFDQYDTYVQSDDIDLQVDTKIEKERENSKSGCMYHILFTDCPVSQQWVNEIFYYSFTGKYAAQTYTTKIFLMNSVWLI